ncbi:MAG: hypothetical protein U1C46_06620 [Bacteroidales bacterium]|nr:hypothetical protein [Bacteroidales bacterium]MDZ4204476.1 hypothetical protein [Bacteroidales bacterium]
MKTKYIFCALSSLAFMIFSCSGSTSKNTVIYNTTSVVKEMEAPFEEATNQGTVKKIYEIKSGYMKIASNMGLTREIWFDDYGNKQYEETYLALGGFKQGAVIVIMDGYKYEYAIGSETGNKTAYVISAGHDYGKLTAAEIEKYGIKELGKETVAGKQCTVFSIEKPMQTKIWIWKGISMKSASSMGSNSITLEVTEIREEKVDQAKFIIPAGIDFREK